MITAEKKLKALPDGIYKFEVKDNFGPQFYTTSFYLQKGKGTLQEIEETMTQKNGSSEAMLSISEAVQNVKEASKATAENEFLKKENEALKAKLAEMDSQIKALQQASAEDQNGMDEEETSAPLDWLKETVPAVLPALDRYFDLKEKELNFKQAKFLHESGYEVPGLPQRKGFPAKKKASQLPEIEGEGWEEFVNYFLNLPDEEYNSRMNWLATNAPQHHEALLPYVEEEEVSEESAEEESETNSTNGNDQD
jgi:hypothetical protein